MHSLTTFAALLALMMPMVAGGNAPLKLPAASLAPQCDAAGLGSEQHGDIAGEVPGGKNIANPLAAYRNMATARQVRIEQRVVVRIAPRVPSSRQELLANLPQRQLAPRFEERSKEKCVELRGIAGVQTGSGNRLVLFLRDSRMLSVNLEKSCRARDFYSGFYVEKNKDGRLCVDRDRLQSRTGASCEVDTMRQLVETDG